MRKVSKKPFGLSVAAFLMSSMTIWFMPMATSGESGVNPLLYVLAVIFWIGFIMGFVFLLPISRQRKIDRRYVGKGGIGLLRFFSNKPAAVFDILLIIGIIVLTISLILQTLPGGVMLTSIFVSVFGIEMHGLFNGKNYEYLCHRR